MFLLNTAKTKVTKVLKRIRGAKFEQIADEWLECKRMSVKKSTYSNYKFIVEKYLKGKFKGVNIVKLNNFGEFIEELSEKYAPKTVRDITNVLKAILSYYEDEYGKKLKYKKINVPKIEKRHLKILTQKEKNKVEDWIVNTFLYNFYKDTFFIFNWC